MYLEFLLRPLVLEHPLRAADYPSSILCNSCRRQTYIHRNHDALISYIHLHI